MDTVDKNSGDKVDRTEWHRVVTFQNGLVEMFEKHARKGRLVYVAGKLQTRKWRKDGEESDRFSTEILLVPGGRIQFLDNPPTATAPRRTTMRRPRQPLPIRPARRTWTTRFRSSGLLPPANPGAGSASILARNRPSFLTATRAAGHPLPARRVPFPGGLPMSSCDFSARDITFRRSGEDEYTIVVYGQNVGSVTRRIDYATPDRSYYYVAHLSEDWKGPRQLDDREEIRPAVAAMLAERDLVPGPHLRCTRIFVNAGTFPPDPLPPYLQPGRSRADQRHGAGPFFL